MCVLESERVSELVFELARRLVAVEVDPLAVGADAEVSLSVPARVRDVRVGVDDPVVARDVDPARRERVIDVVVGESTIREGRDREQNRVGDLCADREPALARRGYQLAASAIIDCRRAVVGTCVARGQLIGTKSTCNSPVVWIVKRRSVGCAGGGAASRRLVSRGNAARTCACECASAASAARHIRL